MFDPIEEVVQDLVKRFRSGERNIPVPSSWRRYFQGITARLFGGRN